MQYIYENLDTQHSSVTTGTTATPSACVTANQHRFHSIESVNSELNNGNTTIVTE